MGVGGTDSVTDTGSHYRRGRPTGTGGRTTRVSRGCRVKVEGREGRDGHSCQRVGRFSPTELSGMMNGIVKAVERYIEGVISRK